MRLERRAPRRRSPIGLTPLIDVVFILLLFFMLASSLTRLQAVALQSRSAGGEAGAALPALLVRVHSDGELDLNGEPLAAGELRAALSSRLTQRPDLSVIVQPADRVNLQALLQVFDQLAEAGVPLLRLQ
jgi:biopolymer transport protein ExbD